MSPRVIELLAIAAKELNYPVVGEFADKLWELLSGGEVADYQAARVYRACGYEPFMGYPLTRLNTPK